MIQQDDGAFVPKRTEHAATPSATYGTEASDHRVSFSGYLATPCLPSQDPYILLECNLKVRQSPQVLPPPAKPEDYGATV